MQDPASQADAETQTQDSSITDVETEEKFSSVLVPLEKILFNPEDIADWQDTVRHISLLIEQKGEGVSREDVIQNFLSEQSEEQLLSYGKDLSYTQDWDLAISVVRLVISSYLSREFFN